jgi:hypothetical protein
LSIGWGKVDPGPWDIESEGSGLKVWDELYEPLGLASGAAAALPVGGIRVSGRAVAAAVAIALAISLFALARSDAPLGGEPFAVAKVAVLPAPPKPTVAAVPPAAHEAVAPTIASAEQVEAASGVKVTRASGGSPPKALIIDVPRALSAKLAPALSNP